jgi:hypothetical protein
MPSLNPTHYILILLVAMLVVQYKYNDSLKEDLKTSKINTAMVAKEFYDLHDGHEVLKVQYDDQEQYYKESIELLNINHKEEIVRATKITSIKTRIEDVKDEDDGNISNILSNTLDALRLYE